ncbi:MAG: hypothetical protein OXK80_01585 [Bdellovibrionales bacterium]|nr:hypothetical protein [Bdellovibrionales bacterium]
MYLFRFVHISFICSLLLSLNTFAQDQDICEGNFKPSKTSSEARGISKESKVSDELADFHRRPKRTTTGKVNVQNRFLRLKDARTDFHDRKAYEEWLIRHQKAGTLPKHPYGYRAVQVKGLDVFGSRGDHKTKPRIAPVWINNTKLFDNDRDIQREYMFWAEEYYQKSQFYPPVYLDWMKDQILLWLIDPRTSSLEGGIKEDRRLKDVVLSLGGKRKTTAEEHKDDATLIALIKTLSGNDTWLDVGTGSGYVLEDGILGLHRAGRSINKIPHTIGMTYRTRLLDIEKITTVHRPHKVSPPDYRTHLTEKLSVKHKIRDDLLFENIPDQELPRPKLITDFYGAFSYSANPASVVSRYLNIITADGTIGIVYTNKLVVKLGNKEVSFWEWLESVTKNQFSIERGTSWIQSPDSPFADEEGYIETWYVLIQNPSGKFVELPDLVQVGFGSKDGRFRRVFRPASDTRNVH